MAKRTYNRNPMNAGMDYYEKQALRDKYFNINEFKGINTNKNYVGIDQQTFADANNMYVNQDNELSTRPPVRSISVPGLISSYEVFHIWKYSNNLFYHIKDSTKYYITGYYNSNRFMWECMFNTPLYCKGDVFFYYDKNENLVGQQYDNSRGTFRKLHEDEIVYVPDENDEPNIFTDRKKQKRRLEPNESIPADFLGHTVDIIINDVKYTITATIYNEKVIFTPLTTFTTDRISAGPDSCYYAFDDKYVYFTADGKSFSACSMPSNINVNTVKIKVSDDKTAMYCVGYDPTNKKVRLYYIFDTFSTNNVLNNKTFSELTVNAPERYLAYHSYAFDSDKCYMYFDFDVDNNTVFDIKVKSQYECAILTACRARPNNIRYVVNDAYGIYDRYALCVVHTKHANSVLTAMSDAFLFDKVLFQIDSKHDRGAILKNHYKINFSNLKDGVVILTMFGEFLEEYSGKVTIFATKVEEYNFQYCLGYYKTNYPSMIIEYKRMCEEIYSFEYTSDTFTNNFNFMDVDITFTQSDVPRITLNVAHTTYKDAQIRDVLETVVYDISRSPLQNPYARKLETRFRNYPYGYPPDQIEKNEYCWPQKKNDYGMYIWLNDTPSKELPPVGGGPGWDLIYASDESPSESIFAINKIRFSYPYVYTKNENLSNITEMSLYYKKHQQFMIKNRTVLTNDYLYYTDVKIDLLRQTGSLLFVDNNGNFAWRDTRTVYVNKWTATDEVYIVFNISGANSVPVFEHFVQSFVTVASYQNKLYICVENKTEKYQLYAPRSNVYALENNITNIAVLDSETIAVFLEDKIKLVLYNDGNILLTESRLSLGCKRGADVLNNYDGSATFVTTLKGLTAITGQQFLATQDQAYQYLTDSVLDMYDKFAVSPIKLYLYKYWLFMYRQDSNETWLYDLRAGCWWRWTLPYNITQIIQNENELLLLLNERIFHFELKDTEFTDLVDQPIDWHIMTQRLHFNAPNNYKHVRAVNIISSQDTSYVRYNMRFINYRNVNNTKEDDTVEFLIRDMINAIVRVSFIKTNAFQCKLSADITNEAPTKFVISNLSIKYRITENIR